MLQIFLLFLFSIITYLTTIFLNCICFRYTCTKARALLSSFLSKEELDEDENDGFSYDLHLLVMRLEKTDLQLHTLMQSCDDYVVGVMFDEETSHPIELLDASMLLHSEEEYEPSSSVNHSLLFGVNHYVIQTLKKKLIQLIDDVLHRSNILVVGLPYLSPVLHGKLKQLHYDVSRLYAIISN